MQDDEKKINSNDQIPDEIVELWGQAEDSAETTGASEEIISSPQPANFLDAGLKRRVKYAGTKKPMLAFSAFVILIVLVLQGAGLVASGLNAKDSVELNANAGFASLKEAQELLNQQDFVSAEQKLLIAEQSFISAQKDLDNLGGLINALLKISKQGSAADNLLLAGERIASAGISFNSFRALIGQVKVSAEGLQAPDGFYGTVNAAKKYLQAARENLAEASSALSRVDAKALPGSFSGEFLHYRDALSSASQLFTQASNLLDIFHKFLGPGTKSILVLFENNAEMRATGGFIGTYGFFKFNDGKIISQKITSVYDLDGQIKDKVAPPGPFHELTNRWGLRDSNWFADFRNSAQKASTFYEAVGRETPDAVVAVTPDLFVDLLAITGPIYFEKYKLALAFDNFREQIQNATSDNFEQASSGDAPKQLLADFAPLFLQTLADLPKEKNPQLLVALLANLRKKNVLFYDRNPEIQKGFEDYDWAGALAPNEFDYLEIVNSNLGGKKTDLDIDHQAELKSVVLANGDIMNTLTYTRNQKNNLANKDKNVTYSRFYVPAGSTLLSATGFTLKNNYKSDGSDYLDYYENPNDPYVQDPDLTAIDATITIDSLSGTSVGQESGKTFFGNWIETTPGTSTTVVLKYKLPFGLTQKKYSMLLQKQPGSVPIDFTYTLDLPQAVLWYTPDTLKLSEHLIEWKSDLNADQFIGMVVSQD